MKKLIAPLALLIATLLAPTAFAADPQAAGLLQVTYEDGSSKLFKVDDAKAGQLKGDAQAKLAKEIVANAANEVKDLGALTQAQSAFKPRAACWFGGGYQTIQWQQQSYFWGGYQNYQPVVYQPIWNNACNGFIGGCQTVRYYGGCFNGGGGCGGGYWGNHHHHGHPWFY